MSQIDFLGYSLAVNPFPIILDKEKKIIINTINQNAFCVAERDLLFKSALQASDILLPDGMSIVKACKYITGKRLKKIAGADMHNYLLKMLNETKGKCFYLGASQETLNKIAIRMQNEYPLIETGYYSPPYKKSFDEKDIQTMVKNINNFSPDIVFVGLTAPKQEKLVHLIKENIETRLICSIGAVFDFYAGTITRPSEFWINLNLEWFIRFAKEPRRMWKRYLYYGAIFTYDIIVAKIKTINYLKKEIDKNSNI
ncbi:WecB/TagA/CpsF family glycosyltransferase [Spirosoma flavum]|uniref:WecB/TagA/CpsF family glycosyltransferase n=1 Tax=Spirosoma flavum TaxID=2048557 RepID=A0ABW6ASM5_9BACT